MKRVQIIGNITKDCEVRKGNSTKSAIGFDVAVNEQWRDRASGEKKKRVSYIKCVIWRENVSIAQYLTKGTKVYVEGSPEVDCYVNKDGNAVGSVKIIVSTAPTGILFLGGGRNQQQGDADNSTNQSSASDVGSDALIPTPDDDLPF